MRSLLRCGIVAAALAAGLPSAAAAEPGVLLALEPGATTSAVVREGGELVSSPLRLWRVDAETAERIVPGLRRQGLLRYAAPDRVRKQLGHVDAGDPLLSSAWQLERIGATAIEPPPAGVPITIVDSLVDKKYPELADRPNVTMLTDHTTCEGNDTPHATTVAAIAAAPADGVGTVGVYPTASLWSANACNLEDSDIIAAIDAASARGESVITLPLGGPGYSRPLYEAVMRAVGNGSVVVAAAGNYRGIGDPIIFPAAYPHVLTVGSTDEQNAPSSFSGTSSGVDIVAPGERIPLLDPKQPATATTVTGTSFATPIVAAAAAWVWSVRRTLDPSQVFELLRVSAKDVGDRGVDRRTGFGLLDLPAALNATPPPVDPQEPNDDVDLVKAGGVFATAKQLLAGGETIAASVDRSEDPRDVYRVEVAPGKRFRVTLTAPGRLEVAIWAAGTKTVLAVGRSVRRNRLAAGEARPGAPGRVAYRNGSGRAVVVYVEIEAAKSARASYALTLS